MILRRNIGIALLAFALLAGQLPAETSSTTPTRRSMGQSANDSRRVAPMHALRGRPEGEIRKIEDAATSANATPPKSAPSPPATSSTTASTSSWQSSPRYQASLAYQRSLSQPSTAPIYPWKKDITTTIFWIGEKPSGRNKTPNHKSSWDVNWKENYGGYDDPDPANRTSDFRPKGFIPGQNPFYVALPYNDVVKWNETKREAPHVIPWFRQKFEREGRSVCKGRWIAIHYNGRTCYAQWEDCGPWTTDDWNYVFGNARPKTRENKGAGLDVSPAVRDFLGMRSGAKTHWRFVEKSEVPPGPWRKFGANNPFANGAGSLEPSELERLKAQRAAWLRKQHSP
ncbi:MAG: hypothetical protein AAGA58_01000 [Verrucomicrobiota bacterium]